MTWPFLYLPGDRLSAAELTAARLDGDVVEVGEGFIPADAVETRELRAASLRPLVADQLVVTHASAAWVHGAVPEPPVRHSVQRLSAHRIHQVVHGRLRYRDGRMRPDDAVTFSGVAVTTVGRTLADLVRADYAAGTEPGAAAQAMARLPGAVAWAIEVLQHVGPVTFKRPAMSWLRDGPGSSPGRDTGQDEVTRYTS